MDESLVLEHDPESGCSSPTAGRCPLLDSGACVALYDESRDVVFLVGMKPSRGAAPAPPECPLRTAPVFIRTPGGDRE